MLVAAYEPKFIIRESSCPAIGSKKLGETFKAIINYQVVEKTKSFVVIRIGHVQPEPKIRIN
jgi:hypothetical protein